MARLRFALLTTVGALALSGLASVATAGAQAAPELAAPLTITKVVEGPVPTGTTFTVTVTCPDANIDDGTQTVENGLTSATVTFDATGTPTSDNVIGFVNEGNCTVTETATGAASTVSYACTGEIPQEGPPADPCFTHGPGPITVLIEQEEQFATVTVTNTFTVPEAAPAVVVQPAFTG